MDSDKIQYFKFLLNNPELIHPDDREFVESVTSIKNHDQWKNSSAYARANFFTNLVFDISEIIDKSLILSYPLNIQHLEASIEFIDHMVSINLNTDAEKLAIAKNGENYIQLKKSILKKIETIKKQYKSEENNLILENFPSLFKSMSHYNYVMQKLVEKGYVQTGTYKWIEEVGGNLTLLVSIIKSIDSKKYFRQKKNLTNKQIQNIALFHFGIEISDSLISKHKLKNTDSKLLNIIPVASTLIE